MPKKKIGIVGWWDGKNEGDNYIKHCLTKKLGDEYRLEFIGTPFSPNKWNLWKINQLDFLIIGGGGLFTKSPPYPFSSFNHWGKHLKTDFGFLGVGIREVSQEYKPLIEELASKSKFFVVRDKESLELIRPFSPEALQAPDLTFLYPRKIQRNAKEEEIGVNLRIWNFEGEKQLDTEKWSQAINSLPGNKRTVPLSFKKGLDDRQAMELVQGSKSKVFDMDLYRGIGCMIGTRLHSLVFAAQNAIPVIGIAYTPKISRFFSELGLGEFCLGLDEYGLLEEKFQHALERQEEISDKLNKYTAKATASASKCLEDIKSRL